MKFMKYNQIVWEEDMNKHFILTDDYNKEVNNMGKTIRRFIPYISGCKYRNCGLIKQAISKNTSLSSKQCGNIIKFDGYSQFPRPLTKKYWKSLKKKKIAQKLEEVFNRIFKITPNSELSDLEESSGRYSPLKSNCGIVRKSKSFCEKSPDDYLPIPLNLKNNLETRKFNGKLPNLFHNKTERNNYKMHSNKREKNNKSFVNIQEDIKRQIKENMQEGRNQKSHNISFKGIYTIALPTEGEISERAKKFRKIINPEAFDFELKKEKRERELFEKKVKQREVIYKLMLANMKRKNHSNNAANSIILPEIEKKKKQSFI